MISPVIILVSVIAIVVVALVLVLFDMHRQLNKSQKQSNVKTPPLSRTPDSDLEQEIEKPDPKIPTHSKPGQS